MFLRYSVPKPLSRILSLVFLGFLFLLQTNGSWSQDVTTTLEQRQLQSRALNQKIIESLDPEQEYVNMGCYRMRVEQFINLFGSQDQKGSFGPNAFLGDISLWTDGIVPFTINPAGIEEGSLDANGNTITGREQMIHDAMEAISSAAQIQFVELPWEPEQQNYIEFRDDQNAAFNYSTQLGMYPFPAKQSIVIVSWNLGVIIHEICHALGMIHEQNRSDRDSYVDIIEENLQEGPSVPYQFAIVTTSDNAGTEYDFGSIMHYGHNYFAKSPGLTTIQPLPAYTAFKYQMGQRTGLSDSDKAALANQYGSKPVQSTPGISPGAGSYLGPLAVNLVIPDP
ncbi:MAG: hypothetical protein KC994_16930, partial [Candidatus Omnitrophica bacterium]|nr:hypothetical protein [Candidatus Omnitrophota bacterium]